MPEKPAFEHELQHAAPLIAAAGETLPIDPNDEARVDALFARHYAGWKTTPIWLKGTADTALSSSTDRVFDSSSDSSPDRALGMALDVHLDRTENGD